MQTLYQEILFFHLNLFKKERIEDTFYNVMY